MTGTNTGNALTYAKDVILTFNRGRRRGAKPVVIVVTDGKSQDDVVLPAERLRRSGIEVRVNPEWKSLGIFLNLFFFLLDFCSRSLSNRCKVRF